MKNTIFREHREAQILLHKTWAKMPNSNLDQVKELCIKWLEFSLDIGLDYVSNPKDALELTKKINLIKQSILEF